MTRKLIIQKFCIDYGVKTGSEEFKNLTMFADEIKSTEILRKVLDSSNHPSTKTGSKPRPNMATLRILLGKFIQERVDENRQETMSAVSSEEDCWYCTAGYVLGIQERRGLWSTYTAGRCECSQGDDTGQMAHKRFIRPTQEIQDYARDCEITCPEAVDRMVHKRNKPYRDERQLEITAAPLEITAAPTGPEPASEPVDYDFGDGFEREVEDIPF